MCALLVLALSVSAQNTPALPQNWETSVAGVPSTVVVPNSSTRVVAISSAAYVRVNQVNFTNITGGAITVTFTDGSTNCNGGACNLLPTTTPLSIASGTTYTINLNGQPAVGGVFWSASAANSIHGWARGTR